MPTVERTKYLSNNLPPQASGQPLLTAVQSENEATFKEDLGWFSVFMLIGVPFLPTTNWLHKLRHLMMKFVKPIRGW